jgi:hypothetical protein
MATILFPAGMSNKKAALFNQQTNPAVFPGLL